MNTKDMKPNQVVAALWRKRMALRAALNTPNYFKLEEQLKGDLRAVITASLIAGLSASNLLRLCDMVGSYRPVPLHSFLGYYISEANTLKSAEKATANTPTAQ